jgi:nucleotide-binding universal stress UspA family protein
MTTSLINPEGRVLAAVDASIYAQSVAECAGWAASRLQASLKLLHVIERNGGSERRDLSGSLSLGTQENLLAELASLDEQRARLAQEHGRALLEGLRDRIAAHHGVAADIRQRHGALLEALLELEDSVRLFVIGKRGEHVDFAKGHLGSNLERVLRAVHRPVLVCARSFRRINRFLIAFDGSATTRKCVELVCASPLLKDVACELLMVGEGDGAQLEQLAWAATCLRAAGFEPAVHAIAGSPETVITRQVETAGIDLLVMGAYGHSRIRSMILGSTTTQLLRSCPIPVLLLR